jgi:MFS family permease
LHILIYVGTFLTVFGLMMASLATQYYQVFLSLGVCVGLGSGCLFVPSVAIAAAYFTTKRAAATGLVASGGSIGNYSMNFKYFGRS